MRPQRLQIKGFGAFRNETEVDFDGVDLLALVGPTGSGKSTLIDAMAFALYGSVVRYDNRKKVVPAINQLSNEARVRLDFELSGEGYTAVRVVRRAKLSAKSEARLQRGDEVLADGPREVSDAVTGLLGLDFDRFVKTVVLPQGRFASFLHDSMADRQELLRDLLGIGVYERMGRAARARARDAGIRAETLEGQLDGRAVLDDTEFAALQAEAVAVEACRPILDAVLADAETAADALSAARAELTRLDQLVEAVESVAVPDDVAVLADRLAASEAGLSELAKAVVEATAAREVADRSVAEGPDRDRLRDLVDQHERRVALQAEIERLMTDVGAAETELAQAATTVASLDAEIDELRAAAAGAAQAATTAAAERESGPRLADIDRQRQLWADHAEAVVHLASADDAMAAAEAAQAEAEKVVVDAITARDRAQAAVESCRTAVGAAALAAHLEVGAECPVCLRAVDKLPEHPDADRLVDAEADAQATAAAVSTAQAVLDGRRSVVVAEETRRAGLADRVAQLAEQLTEIPGVDDLERLAEQAIRLDARVGETAEAARRAQMLVADLEGSDGVASARSEHQRADKVVADLRSQLAVKEKDRQTLDAALADGPDAAHLATQLAEADARLAEQVTARVAESEARAAQATAVTAHDELLAAERSQRSHFDATRNRLVALDPPTPSYMSLAGDWDQLVSWSAAQHDDLSRTRDDARAAVPLAEADHAQILDKAVHLVTPHLDEVQAGVAPARLAVLLAQAAERLRGQVDVEAAARDERRAQIEQIDKLREGQQVAAELGRLLDARSFEQWLMEEVIDDLVARATVRLLTLTGGRYGLSRSAGNDFEVVDHQNAGESRDVKTLSGGETFLASLALALGLADALTELSDRSAPALESIFLDEGFGTLDADTLDVVAAAIEELGATGRMVGIVTHIPDLAERMPVRFEVKQGLDSSLVHRVEV